MKKGFKYSMAAVIAASALTPAIASADEAKVANAAPGVYNLEAGATTPYLSFPEFQELSTKAKTAWLLNAEVVIVTNGLVYSSTDVISMSNEDLETAGIPELEFEETNDVDLTDKGEIVKPGDKPALAVESVSAINKTTVKVTLSQKVDAVIAKNFTIEGAKVEAATLAEDDKTVTLKVSGLEYSTDYVLAAKDIKVDGEAKDFGTKAFSTGAVTDVYDLKLVSADEEVTADGADNTVIEFQLHDKVTGEIDTNADDIVLEIGTTFGNLANSRVTVQNGVGKVVLASEFSTKEVIAKVTAQIIEASGDYKDLIGKVSGEMEVKFVTSKVSGVDGIQLLDAESNQADRVVLYFDKEVGPTTFAQLNKDGSFKTEASTDNLLVDKQVPVKNAKITVKQGTLDKEVVGFNSVEGNPKAIEVILAKGTPLKDNAKVEVHTELGTNVVDKSFTLTDARQPELTSVTPGDLKTLNLKFSESVAKGNFTIDGIWSAGKEFTIDFGEFDASTGKDYRDTATIELGKYVAGTEGFNDTTTDANNENKQRYFAAGSHSISVTQLADFAGLSDPANVSSAQKLDFTVAADEATPVASVTVESPEQFRVKFDKDVTETDVLNVIFKEALQVKDSAGKDVLAGTAVFDKLEAALVVTPAGIVDNEYVIELNADWTTILPAKDSYTNYKVSFKVAANSFTSDTNGKGNAETILNLNYAGSALNTIDNASPVISAISSYADVKSSVLPYLGIDGSKGFVVSMNEPVKLSTKATPSFDNASNTPSVEQGAGTASPAIPQVLVEFQGKDKDGKDVIVKGDVKGYADKNAADKQFFVEASENLQDAVDAGTYQSNWKVVVKSISDDVGNTAETLTKDFTIEKEVSLNDYEIVSPENDLADGVIAYNYPLGDANPDRVEILFTKGVVNNGGTSDLTNASNWTLNGEKLPDVASITVVDTNGDTKDGYEKVVITFKGSNVLKADSNVISVNKNIVSLDGTKLTGEFEVVAKTITYPSVVATDQAEVDAIIAGAPENEAITLDLNNVTEAITINTAKELNITINGDLKGQDLTVNAPQSHVNFTGTNAGLVTISDVSNSSFVFAAGADATGITFADTNGGRLAIAAGATAPAVTLAAGANATLAGAFTTVTAEGNATIVLDDAQVATLATAADSTVTVSGEGTVEEKTGEGTVEGDDTVELPDTTPSEPELLAPLFTEVTTATGDTIKLTFTDATTTTADVVGIEVVGTVATVDTIEVVGGELVIKLTDDSEAITTGTKISVAVIREDEDATEETYTIEYNGTDWVVTRETL